MAAWLASPYRAVNIYVGGSVRGCAQPNLTSAWVSAVTAQGWWLIPTYVGLQAPGWSSNVARNMSAAPATAASQGQAAAQDAIAQMVGLGLTPSVPIYYDMENYDPRDATVVAAVKAFTNAWTATLHASGWTSGIYGSTSSMIRNLVGWRSDASYSLPDQIWLARWDGVATTDDSAVPADAWPGRRIKQFQGPHNETWGGVTLAIDSDITSNYVGGAPSQAGAFGSIAPYRVLDTRAKIGVPGTTPVAGNGQIAVKVTGVGGVPTTGVSAVIANVTLTQPTSGGHITVWASGSPRPTASNLNFVKGQTVPNLVVAPVGPDGKIMLENASPGTTHLIADIAGYYLAGDTGLPSPVD